MHKDTTYQGSDRQDFYRHGKKKTKKKEKKENKQTKRRPRLGLPIGNPVISANKVKTIFAQNLLFTQSLKPFFLYEIFFFCAKVKGKACLFNIKNQKPKENLRKFPWCYLAPPPLYMLLSSNPTVADCFEILDSALTKFQLKLKEAMHINWEKPNLTQQVHHVNLTLML